MSEPPFDISSHGGEPARSIVTAKALGNGGPGLAVVAASILVIVFLAVFGFRALGGLDQNDTAIQRVTPEPAVVPGASEPAATPQPESVDSVSLPAEENGLQATPLGTFVVAKHGAGIARTSPSLGGVAPLLDIAVYDQPFGLPRSLVDVNDIDGVRLPVGLTNWADQNGVLVLRVIAGGPDDEWVQVQAPSRPHDRYVWVRSADFDFGTTTKRIEIDIAGEGQLTLFDGDVSFINTAIVHGRPLRETPTHVTYVEGGVSGERVGPAYGSAVLSIASYSEKLGTFGNGIPSNFLHGTNQPGLMGQQLSSGEIRIENETLEFIIGLITPGTPVLLFDSSTETGNRDAILERVLTPAVTVPFDDGTPAIREKTATIIPRLWTRCGSDSGVLFCRGDISGDADFGFFEFSGTHDFAVARADAGEQTSFVDQSGETQQARVIPVYDSPGGEQRTLVHTNPIDGREIDYPLFAQTVFGQPLVLSVLQGTPASQWLLVRSPTLPHNHSVWVERKYFDLDSTTVRIEVDIGYEFVGKKGILTVWDNGEILAAKISSGRDTRPTVATSTYVDQIIDGTTLAPAYGPWVLSTPSYSETLGTFGGGGQPQQAIHGIRPGVDEILGTPQSSGSIHVSYETIEQIAELDGILGAPVYIYDSSQPEHSLQNIRSQWPWPATTKPQQDALLIAPVGSFT